MREQLFRTRQVDGSIRAELLREAGERTLDPAKRVLIDLIDLRITVLDKLIDQFAAEAATPFAEAAERVRRYFDKDEKTPYRNFRGATPTGEPSLAKDIVILFEEMAAHGCWSGPVPVLDPKWNPQ